MCQGTLEGLWDHAEKLSSMKSCQPIDGSSKNLIFSLRYWLMRCKFSIEGLQAVQKRSIFAVGAECGKGV